MSNQRLSPCKESVKECILKRPVTFMKLVSETQCATETVEKYLSIFLEDTIVKQKKGKFRIIYSPELDKTVVEFYELLLNPTIKAIIIGLLKSQKPLSQMELVIFTEKSNPSISRGLKELLESRIIQRNYHAPFSTYQIINKEKIFKKLEKTFPEISNSINDFDLCYPELKKFLESHK